MRVISSVSVTTAALATALILNLASPPAKAGPACNRIGLNSPCIMSNDLKARINLRESGRDGRLQIRDADNATAFNLDGSSANVTNLFSNDEDESNGLVKAWARINADGTIIACWRCNTDPAETRRLDVGFYEVDFTPLATDISGRPRLCVSDEFVDDNFCSVGGSDDLSSVEVAIFNGSDGATEEGDFTVMIF